MNEIRINECGGGAGGAEMTESTPPDGKSFGVIAAGYGEARDLRAAPVLHPERILPPPANLGPDEAPSSTGYEAPSLAREPPVRTAGKAVRSSLMTIWSKCSFTSAVSRSLQT